MEININTNFDESDRAFMLTIDNTYTPVEIIQIHSVEHDVNAYCVSIFKVIYEVKTLNPFRRYTVYEDKLYSLEDMEKLLFN